jgi:hypothetical protein
LISRLAPGRISRPGRRRWSGGKERHGGGGGGGPPTDTVGEETEVAATGVGSGGRGEGGGGGQAARCGVVAMGVGMFAAVVMPNFFWGSFLLSPLLIRLVCRWGAGTFLESV